MSYAVLLLISMVFAVPVDMGDREFAPESASKAPQVSEETELSAETELEYRPQNDGCMETKNESGNVNGFKCKGALSDNKNYQPPYGGMKPAEPSRSSDYVKDMINKHERLYFQKNR